MRRSRWLPGLLLLTLLAGCSGVKPAPRPADEPPIPADLKVPDLATLTDPHVLSLPQLAQGLEDYLNQTNEPPLARLTALYEKWRLRPLPGTELALEADLDGDGHPELITALNTGTFTAIGSGTLFIIHQENGRYRVDRGKETVLGASVVMTGDLTGDGQPEILWSSTSAGANTTMTTLFLSSWRPGSITNLGEPVETTYGKAAIENGDLLVTGGWKGGWGAGRVQRERIDHFHWQDGNLVLIDQRFTPSAYAYHRLIDGILAEEWNRLAEAQQAYTEALEPHREPIQAEDTVPPEGMGAFTDAVRLFARYRLGLLHLREGQVAQTAQGLPFPLGQSPAESCQAATDWATSHPDFLTALNSPRGWATIQWKPSDLCGPLPIQ